MWIFRRDWRSPLYSFVKDGYLQGASTLPSCHEHQGSRGEALEGGGHSRHGVCHQICDLRGCGYPRWNRGREVSGEAGALPWGQQPLLPEAGLWYPDIASQNQLHSQVTMPMYLKSTVTRIKILSSFRSFSDWYFLQRTLQNLFPQTKIKELPPRQVLWIKRPQLKLEEIATFLQNIVSNKNFVHSRIIQLFLQSNLSTEFIQENVDGKRNDEVNN